MFELTKAESSRGSPVTLRPGEGLGVGAYRVYLNPKSMQNNSPKPLKTAQKAIILHTLGVQVGFFEVQGFRVSGLGIGALGFRIQGLGIFRVSGLRFNVFSGLGV